VTSAPFALIDGKMDDQPPDLVDLTKPPALGFAAGRHMAKRVVLGAIGGRDDPRRAAIAADRRRGSGSRRRQSVSASAFLCPVCCMMKARSAPPRDAEVAKPERSEWPASAATGQVTEFFRDRGIPTWRPAPSVVQVDRRQFGATKCGMAARIGGYLEPSAASSASAGFSARVFSER
jgi:hypothetical protein